MTFTNGVYNSAAVTLVMNFICSTAETATYTTAHDSNSKWTVTVTAAACCAQAAPSQFGGRKRDTNATRCDRANSSL